MSATNRCAERDALDRYDTPAWCVRRLAEAIRLPVGGCWLEPSAGRCAIVDALPASAEFAVQRWTLLDIEPRDERVQRADFLTWEPPHRYDICISNPPYALAFEFAQKCVAIADTTVLLLRLNWLASAKRAEWMRRHTPSIYVLPNRPSFTGKGTDATDYCWAVWRTDGSTPEVRILATTPAEERRAQ